MYYENVFAMLQKTGVRYAVAGGVALVLHGVVRFTADLDIIVDLEKENLTRFLQAMRDLGYGPRNPVKAEAMLDPVMRKSWKLEKNMTMFSFVDPAQPMAMIDVFLEEILPFKDVEKELARIQAKGITIPVISLRHLKELKKRAGRPQDLADIEAIETMEKEGR